MNVRLNYIIEQQANVLAVPYAAVYNNDAGESCILIAEEQSAGAYRVKELKVTKLIENDIEIGIGGDNIAEGMRVINEPDLYRMLEGREVTLGRSAQQNRRAFPMR